MPTYDAIVLGTGGVGSAALLELARRGVKALGLDRFPPAHDRGSSHGETRIIRQAYFEHPDYVPLAKASYGWWREIEDGRGSAKASLTEEPLYVPTGLLQIGPAEGQVLAGVRASAATHGLAIENLSRDDINARWSGYVVPDNCEGVYERDSGYLRVEACVQSHLDQAVAAGAELRCEEPAVSWRVNETTTPPAIEVVTANETYSAGHLVITAGAWASQLLFDLGFPLVVRRKPQYWFTPANDDYSRAKNAPAVLFELPQGVFYSFPQLGDRVKVAEHSGGTVVEDATNIDREVDGEDLARVEDFCRRHMPGLTQNLVRHGVCMYTLTPDEHFIVDRHPRHANVAFAAGMSGHGFKFTGVLGKALVDLVLEGETDAPIGFLNCEREALRNQPLRK